MSLLFGDSREFCDFYEVRIVKIDRDKCIQYPETRCTYKGMLRLCSTCQRWFVWFLLDVHGSYGDDSSSGCAYELIRNISHKYIYTFSPWSMRRQYSDDKATLRHDHSENFRKLLYIDMVHGFDVPDDEVE